MLQTIMWVIEKEGVLKPVKQPAQKSRRRADAARVWKEQEIRLKCGTVWANFLDRSFFIGNMEPSAHAGQQTWWQKAVQRKPLPRRGSGRKALNVQIKQYVEANGKQTKQCADLEIWGVIGQLTNSKRSETTATSCTWKGRQGKERALSLFFVSEGKGEVTEIILTGMPQIIRTATRFCGIVSAVWWTVMKLHRTELKKQMWETWESSNYGKLNWNAQLWVNWSRIRILFSIEARKAAGHAIIERDL